VRTPEIFLLSGAMKQRMRLSITLPLVKYHSDAIPRHLNESVSTDVHRAQQEDSWRPTALQIMQSLFNSEVDYLHYSALMHTKGSQTSNYVSGNKTQASID